MIKNIVNLGDASIYCDFGNEVNKETNLKVIKYFKTIKNKKVKGVTNLSPSYNKLIITFDLNDTSFDKLCHDLSNLDSTLLANYLGSYAETGDEYVKILKQIINQNSLKDFDKAKILPTSKNLQNNI